MEDYTLFLDYVGKNYETIKSKLKLLSNQHKQPYDDDAYHEVVIRCHNAIKKKGFLKDKSDYGIQSYIIVSYFNYLREIKRAAHNKKRDRNFDSDNIDEVYEQYYTKHNTSVTNKIQNDLYKDFAILYIMEVVEENFDNEHFYLFKVKHLSKDMTYKKLAEKTKIKGARQKVLEVKKFLQENVTKDIINKAFNEIFGELL